jgi:glycopeptide antibiotics resistance protein
VLAVQSIRLRESLSISGEDARITQGFFVTRLQGKSAHCARIPSAFDSGVALGGWRGYHSARLPLGDQWNESYKYGGCFVLYVFMLTQSTISGFLPLLPMMALFHMVMRKMDRKNHRKTATPHMGAAWLFCFALVLILAITAIPNAYDLTVDPRLNLVPFAQISSNFDQYALNILLFVPIGFLLPFLWKKFEKKYLTFLWGFFFSLSIEIIQMFSDRVTDIDDLLMNTVGTIIGYFLWRLTKRVFPRISAFAIDPTDHWKWEPYACFCFAWLSILFLQPFAVGWFWGIHKR